MAGKDPPDWCSEAVERVKEGSDGLWVRVICGSSTLLALNPFVTLLATIVLFGFVIYCTTQTVGDYCFRVVTSEDGLSQFLETQKCSMPSIEFGYAQKWVTIVWTWLYIITQDFWCLFAIVICFSKYGKLKCGKDDEPPEFSFFSYFAMIFSCGVAAGLFFYSVAEPVGHFEPCSGPPNEAGPDGKCTADKFGNRYSMNPDNLRAQQAMHLTLYHWGIHGWVCYCLVGITMALLHYRKGLPMTMKTTLYPLFGSRVYGCMGDVLDTMGIVGTTFGICTTLGLATMQINDGIKRRNGGNHWIGLGHYGEDNFNEWSEGLSSLKGIWDMATPDWKESNPWFRDSINTTDEAGMGTAIELANLIKNNEQEVIAIWIITTISTISLLAGMHYGIQVVGNFTFILGVFLLFAIVMLDDTWYILNFWCQSLGYYLQHIIETTFYTGAFDQPEHSAPDGQQEYAAWMNDWTLFYWGSWIAWGPLVGTFLARISKGRTIREFLCCCCFGSTLFNYIWLMTWGGAGLKMEMAAKKYGIDSCSDPTRNICREASVDRYTGEPKYLCSSLTRLSCLSATNMMPSLLEQYSDIGIFLALIALFACCCYFVASSDSGSLVDSMLSSNGLEEPPNIQRFYWSLTEGAACSALLYTGRFTPQARDASLTALRSVSVVIGLPWTFICSFLCISLWRACQYEFGDRIWGKGFRSSVVDIGITVWAPRPLHGSGHNFALGSVDFQRLGKFVLNFICPPHSFFQITNTLEARRPKPRTYCPVVLTCVIGLLFYSWLLLVCLDHIPVDHGGYWTSGAVQGAIDTTQRHSTRYGLFYGWSKRASHGMVIKERNSTDDPWQPVGLEYYPDHQENIPVGDVIGTPGILGVFGWFSFLLFTGIVTHTRNSVRLLYKKEGNLLEDFLCTFILYPTVLTQVLETLEVEDVPPDPCDDDPHLIGKPEVNVQQLDSAQGGTHNGHNGHNGHEITEIKDIMLKDFEEVVRQAENRLARASMHDTSNSGTTQKVMRV